VKLRPILFSAEMVRAILEGKKTQTRRVVKYSRDVHCPYGEVGDRLWVRETWCMSDMEPFCGKVAFKADNWTECPSEDGKWKPAIFMPRWASRITLEITEVRRERLQEMSSDDAIEEGALTLPYTSHKMESPLARFRRLWDAINSKNGYSWDDNPYVWAIGFKSVKLKDSEAEA
jgi:hypothetical protein